MILSASLVPPPSPSDNKSGDNLDKFPLIVWRFNDDLFFLFETKSSFIADEFSFDSFVGVANKEEKLSK
jgi:hypothetical protein